MKKIIFFVLLLFPLSVFALEVELNSKSAIVVNRKNDDILYEKNSENKLTIA